MPRWSPSVGRPRFGGSRTSIDTWLAKVARGNTTSLRAKKKRGLLAGARLPAPQAATIVKQIADRTPDQIKLPIVLWTREAVHDLIAQAQQARAT